MTDTDEALFWARREVRPEAVVVRAGGELDAFTTDQLGEHLRAAEDVSPPAAVLLDLTEVTYLSSAGIATLVIHAEHCARTNRLFRVVADQPAVLRPIVLTGADHAIDIVPTLDDAMDVLRSQ